jgi:hypothetical protein
MPNKTRAKHTEFDWNLFVHQPDTQVNDHADAAKQSIRILQFVVIYPDMRLSINVDA